MTNQNTNKMTIKLNKISSVITETGVRTFKTRKALFSFISTLENGFELTCNDTISSKTIKALESLGFNVELDSTWGFDWEVKLFAVK